MTLNYTISCSILSVLLKTLECPLDIPFIPANGFSEAGGKASKLLEHSITERRLNLGGILSAFLWRALPFFKGALGRPSGHRALERQGQSQIAAPAPHAPDGYPVFTMKYHLHSSSDAFIYTAPLQ